MVQYFKQYYPAHDLHVSAYVLPYFSFAELFLG